MASVTFSPVQLEISNPGATCSYQNLLAVRVFRDGELVAHKEAPCLDPFPFGELEVGSYEVAAAYPLDPSYALPPIWGLGMDLMLQEFGSTTPCGSDAWCPPLQLEVQSCANITVPLALYCSPTVSDCPSP